MQKTDDVRINGEKELIPPVHLIREFPCTDQIAALVSQTRTHLHNILHGEDDRLMVVIGPCSIHNPEQALDYARLIAQARTQYSKDLEIVMRVYFEKPRTTVGWKGLINDPDLNGSFQINKGLRTARKLLLDLAEMGVPAGTEFLDVISPQYFADFVSWGAIGARTTESQVHRELASGMSCPIGFKNGTNGDVQIALDAIKAASQPHHFLSVTKGGYSGIFSTTGNQDCHLILRGGKVPNYDQQSVQSYYAEMKANKLTPQLMIDMSHGNSQKNPANQKQVCAAVAQQMAGGDKGIVGVMIESHLKFGRQDIVEGQLLEYGLSITDACLDWESSAQLLEVLAQAVRSRRTA